MPEATAKTGEWYKCILNLATEVRHKIILSDAFISTYRPNKSSIQQEEKSFHQQIGLKFK
jgi:hypothetical protein